ncbi:MAG TPA: phosphate acyltransferase PlsX [bacterium]|nr:phosphate acyltransferase PlsX [bacterium]
MTTIAMDAMGGDFSPRVPVEAALRVARETDCEIVLVGDAAALEPELRRRGHAPPRLHIEHTPEALTPADAPTALLREKPRASVRVACALVAQGRAQAVISAGHTGALMVAAKHELGTLPGIDRPAIATPLPLRRGSSVLLDSGANVDCKPHYLEQFALMGQVYARVVAGIGAPRVALLSNGSEPGKGNELTRAAYGLLAERVPGFVGNVEGRDLFRGKADVLVCDGFVGNLVLKTAEAADTQMRLLMKESIARSPVARLGALLMRGVFAELRRRTDYREVGGSLLLGLGGVALVCHGSSNARTLFNAVQVATQCVQGRLVETLGAEFARQAAAAGRSADTAGSAASG